MGKKRKAVAASVVPPRDLGLQLGPWRGRQQGGDQAQPRLVCHAAHHLIPLQDSEQLRVVGQRELRWAPNVNEISVGQDRALDESFLGGHDGGHQGDEPLRVNHYHVGQGVVPVKVDEGTQLMEETRRADVLRLALQSAAAAEHGELGPVQQGSLRLLASAVPLPREGRLQAQEHVRHHLSEPRKPLQRILQAESEAVDTLPRCRADYENLAREALYVSYVLGLHPLHDLLHVLGGAARMVGMRRDEENRAARRPGLDALHPEGNPAELLLQGEVPHHHVQRALAEEELVRLVVHLLTAKVPHGYRYLLPRKVPRVFVANKLVLVHVNAIGAHNRSRFPHITLLGRRLQLLATLQQGVDQGCLADVLLPDHNAANSVLRQGSLQRVAQIG
mmetsp:Transcript_24316/g.68132  ORF Transcript_24316/g.68132 Transcript_24316/m.68132 type:complete len:390 (+) Transcript_24316:552-1721(+)